MKVVSTWSNYSIGFRTFGAVILLCGVFLFTIGVPFYIPLIFTLFGIFIVSRFKTVQIDFQIEKIIMVDKFLFLLPIKKEIILFQDVIKFRKRRINKGESVGVRSTFSSTNKKTYALTCNDSKHSEASVIYQGSKVDVDSVYERISG